MIHEKHSKNRRLRYGPEKIAKMDLSRTETMGRKGSQEELIFGEKGGSGHPGPLEEDCIQILALGS